MNRTTLSLCTLLLAPLFAPTATAQPQRDQDPPPEKAKEIYTIVKADLFEVDGSFFKKLAKSGWRSMAEWERLEMDFLNPPKDKKPEAESLLQLLDKQKLVHAGKKAAIDPDQEGMLLSIEKVVTCLPSPEALRKGQKKPQMVREGVSLSAEVHITWDRRYLRVKFTEKSREIEGTELVQVGADEEGKEIAGEVVFVKESSQSQVRYIPDGGTILLPLQYQPRSAREKERWFVVRIVPRIYIEAEERQIRGK